AESLAEAERKADNARHQQLAYAGWLTFNKQYQDEKRSLRSRWSSLSLPLPWSISANTVDREPLPVARDEVIPSNLLPAAEEAFLQAFTRFLRKWNVAKLVPWDLPLVRGPLESIPTGLARQLLGPDQVASFSPPYFDIPSRQNVREDVREQQASAARSAGIGNDFPLTDLSAHAGRPSDWEGAFRLWHLERAV